VGDVRDGFTSTQLPTSLRLQQIPSLSWRQPPEYIVTVEPAAEISLLIATCDRKQLPGALRGNVRGIAFDIIVASELRNENNCRIANESSEFRTETHEHDYHRLIQH